VVTSELWTLMPLGCLAGGAFAVYLIARLFKAQNGTLALCTAIAFALALAALLALACAGRATGRQAGLSRTLLQAEPGAPVIGSAAATLGMLVALYSGRYLERDRRYDVYYPLLLLLVAGLVGMVLTGDLFSLYMFCELMSVSAYALVAFRRHTDTAIEAAFKYLIMGSAGTAITLMGISFIYRDAGHLALVPVAQAGAGGAWTRAGLACVLVGLGVKSAIVPLHTWLPDAHGRAPSSVSAMLSGVIIQSAFYAMLKVSLGVGYSARGMGTLLIVCAMLNMTLGNGLALVQTNTKRLLAYSTIAQMGYVMLGVGVGLRYDMPMAIQAAFYLLLAHAAMKGLAFLCKGVCHFYLDTTDTAQLRGTAQQQPLVAIAFALALAGLAGIPPLAGFVGKWLVVTQVLRAADWLAGVGLVLFLLNSVVALGYYLPLIGVLFAPLVPSGERISVSPWMALPIVLLGGLALAIGFYPGPWLDLTAHIGPYLLALGQTR
jgi:proton-translocating NADH-quinone oxidoreductase chain N